MYLELEIIGCCHVMSSTDVNIIKVVTDICDRVVNNTTEKTTKLEKCRQEIFKTCGINITDLISGNKVKDISFNKQTIDEIRSLNGSLCLKLHYGVSLTSLGAIHRLKDYDPTMSKNKPVLICTFYTNISFIEQNYFNILTSYRQLNNT